MPNKDKLGGCEPVGAPTSGYQSIRAKIYELAKDLSPEDYRGVAVTLRATMGLPAQGSGVAVTSGSDTYRVPTTHMLVIEQIRGHLVLQKYDYEYLSMTSITAGFGVGAPPPLDRLAMKALNCRLDLKNSDREQKIIDNQSLSLSVITSLLGGEPLDFGNEPHIVPAGETLVMNAALINSDNAILGGNTEYGLTLVGKLVRVARS